MFHAAAPFRAIAGDVRLAGPDTPVQPALWVLTVLAGLALLTPIAGEDFGAAFEVLRFPPLALILLVGGGAAAAFSLAAEARWSVLAWSAAATAAGVRLAFFGLYEAPAPFVTVLAAASIQLAAIAGITLPALGSSWISRLFALMALMGPGIVLSVIAFESIADETSAAVLVCLDLVALPLAVAARRAAIRHRRDDPGRAPGRRA